VVGVVRSGTQDTVGIDGGATSSVVVGDADQVARRLRGGGSAEIDFGVVENLPDLLVIRPVGC
jgi:hypothetical protein